MSVFTGSRLVAFDVNFPRLRDSTTRSVNNNVFDDLTEGKTHVILRIPHNIHMIDNQKEHILDALFRRRFEIQHITTMSVGTTAMEYVLRRSRNVNEDS